MSQGFLARFKPNSRLPTVSEERQLFALLPAYTYLDS